MTIETKDVDSLLERIKLLPPEYRVQLMHGILETLMPDQPAEAARVLRSGEFEEFDGPLSTYEDYALAEWWPLGTV